MDQQFIPKIIYFQKTRKENGIFNLMKIRLSVLDKCRLTYSCFVFYLYNDYIQYNLIRYIDSTDKIAEIKNKNRKRTSQKIQNDFEPLSI